MIFRILIISTILRIGVNTWPIPVEDLPPKAQTKNDNTFNDEELTASRLRSALREFQKYIFLRPDGSLSVKNVKTIPRCGLVMNTLASEEKWPKFDLNWCLQIPSRKLSVSKQRETLALAFRIWSESSIFKFTEVPCNEADIRFFFIRESVGARYQSDGKGAQQVYVYMPVTSRCHRKEGYIYFDESENWQTERATLLFSAAHAIGHSLGLGHSTEPQSIMVYLFYYPVSVLSTTDKRALQDLYGDSVIVETSKPEKTAVRREDTSTEKPAFPKTKALTQEHTQYPFNNTVKPKKEPNVKLDNIEMASTSLSEFELGSKTQTTPGDYQDKSIILYPNSKKVSTEQVEQHSTTLSILNAGISAEENIDSNNIFIGKNPKEGRVTNEVLNKNSSLNKLESSSIVWSPDPEPVSKTGERHLTYNNASLKQHPEPYSVSTIQLEVKGNYMTSILPGISRSENEKLARNNPHLENETVVDFTDGKTPPTSPESSSRELIETLQPESDQDEQQLPRPDAVGTLGNGQGERVSIWSGVDIMSKRQLETETISSIFAEPETISSTSAEPETKSFTSKNIGRMTTRSKYIPKLKEEADFNFKKLAKNNEKNQKGQNLIFKSEEPELSLKTVSRPKLYQEFGPTSASVENVKPVPGINGKNRKEENLLFKSEPKVEPKSSKRPEHFQEFDQTSASVENVKTVPESNGKNQKKESPLFKSEPEVEPKSSKRSEHFQEFDQTSASMGNVKAVPESNEKNRLSKILDMEQVPSKSANSSTFFRILDTQLSTFKNRSLEQVPRKSANSSKLSKIFDTQLETRKHRSLKQSPKKSANSPTFSKMFNIQVTTPDDRPRKTIFHQEPINKITAENLTWPEIDETIPSLSNRTEHQPSSTSNDKDNTSTVNPHAKFPGKRPCQCKSKIANCESIVCKFIWKVYKVCCYIYMHICAFFIDLYT